MNKYSIVLMLGITATAVAVCSPVRSMLGSNGNEFFSEEWNPSAADYIQDGLVAMWDAEENVGFGQHEDNPMVWKDLSGNGLDMLSNGDPVFYDKYIQPTSVRQMWHTDVTDLMDSVLQDGMVSMELVGEAVPGYQNGNKGCIFGGGNLTGNGIFITFVQTDIGRIGAWGRVGGAVAQIYGRYNPLGYVSVVSDGTSLTTRYKSQTGTFSQSASVSTPLPSVSTKRFCIGYRYTYSGDNPSIHGEKFYCIRIYNRPLSALEIEYNYTIDKMRFGL